MKFSPVAVVVLLGLSGISPAAAEPVRLAQRFVADVIPPYEVFTIIRSAGLRPLGRPHYRGRFYVVHALAPRGEEVRVVVDAYAARVVSIRPLDRYATPEYGGPPIYRRYESGRPPAPGPRVIEAEPRYVPPAPVPRPHASDPRYGAPQALPEDDDDYPGQGPDEFDADEDDRTGSIPSRAIAAPGMPNSVPAPATRSASTTQPKTPLPRPRPQMQASVALPMGDSQQQSPAAAETEAVTSKPAEAKADAPAPEIKSGSKTETAKNEPTKSEAPKSGIRIIEIKKPEPRI